MILYTGSSLTACEIWFSGWASVNCDLELTLTSEPGSNLSSEESDSDTELEGDQECYHGDASEQDLTVNAGDDDHQARSVAKQQTNVKDTEGEKKERRQGSVGISWMFATPVYNTSSLEFVYVSKRYIILYNMTGTSPKHWPLTFEGISLAGPCAYHHLNCRFFVFYKTFSWLILSDFYIFLWLRLNSHPKVSKIHWIFLEENKQNSVGKF